MGRHYGHQPLSKITVRGGTGDGEDPADRRHRHHRPAPAEFREAGRLFHERRPRRVAVERPRHAADRESPRQNAVCRSGQRAAALRVEGARPARREPAIFRTSTITIWSSWPISATDSLMPVRSTRRSGGRTTCFVAAMAQVNSSNYGYNLPVKYVGADYYSLNRTEAELSLHEKDLPSAELIDRMAGACSHAARCRSRTASRAPSSRWDGRSSRFRRSAPASWIPSAAAMRISR